MPKLYFHDPGLACWLLGIREPGQFRSHPFARADLRDVGGLGDRQEPTAAHILFGQVLARYPVSAQI